ncbi:MAG: acetyl-CoA carboxylase biotin carboxyl carrier protein [Bacteroidia bacterium]|jgi:acetyl-CoA carboxylase biotin carboxyl carrier protein
MPLVDVTTEVAGTVWRIEVQLGQPLAEDDRVMLVESMKMEIPVCAPAGGTVAQILVSESAIVAEGDIVARLELK